MRQALVSHEAAEVAAVGNEARHADADVVINLEQLPLELAQLSGCPLHRRQHDMGVALHRQECSLSALRLPFASKGNNKLCRGTITAISHLETHHRGSLLHRLHRILYLMNSPLRAPCRDVLVVLRMQ